MQAYNTLRPDVCIAECSRLQNRRAFCNLHKPCRNPRYCAQIQHSIRLHGQHKHLLWLPPALPQDWHCTDLSEVANPLHRPSLLRVRQLLHRYRWKSRLPSQVLKSPAHPSDPSTSLGSVAHSHTRSPHLQAPADRPGCSVRWSGHSRASSFGAGRSRIGTTDPIARQCIKDAREGEAEGGVRAG